MSLNDDQKTVAAMDVLVTKVQRLLHYGTQCSFRLFTEHCLSIIIIPRFMFFSLRLYCLLSMTVGVFLLD